MIIKSYVKKKKASCWLQTGQASFAGLFGCSRLRGLSLALLSSDQHSASLQPSYPAAPGPIGSGTHPPQGYGCTCGAFHSAHSPRCLGFGLDALHTPAGAPGGWVERRLEMLLQENSPNCPPVSLAFFSLFFLRKSSCSILLLHTRKALSSHTAHLSS